MISPLNRSARKIDTRLLYLHDSCSWHSAEMFYDRDYPKRFIRGKLGSGFFGPVRLEIFQHEERSLAAARRDIAQR